MIQDRWVFDDEYQTRILHRNNELRELSRLLSPARDGRRAEDILVHGPSGVGKTATTRWLLRNLHQESGVESIRIECSNQTPHGIIHKITSRHPQTGIVHENNSREQLLETLDDVCTEPTVVILDEASIIPDLGVLGDLLSVAQVSVIAIAHQQREWLARLDEAIRPHFPADSQIEFRKYHEDELVEILEPRVEHGLVGWPVRDGQLEWIADETNGVARWAIKTVLSAAELAEERCHDDFHAEDVRDAFERAKRKIRKANLRSLPVPHLRLYEIVREVGPISGTEMRELYDEHKTEVFDGVQQPVTWRRAWDYLSKLADYDLIEMPGETNSKVYVPVDESLEAPVEFEVLRVTQLD